MAKHAVVWLGDNAARSLTDPTSGKAVGVGEKITLEDGQIKALKRAGHRFADPQGDEGKAAQNAANNQTSAP